MIFQSPYPLLIKYICFYEQIIIIKISNMKKLHSKKSGFTLIEVLVVIGIIAVLAAVVLVAVNPARQFKLARDSQRTSNVQAILNAVGQNISEHKGIFTCPSLMVPIPSSPTLIADKVGLATTTIDIAPCVVPDYISALPYDPSATSTSFSSTTDYNTGYFISENSDGRITVSAEGELTHDISVSR
jgi:type IV pilus assembly protein PilA